MSGFYQVPISPASRHLTGFATTFGHYQFKRMPFGLTNSPAVFMRKMSKVVATIVNKPNVYVDDTLLASKTISEGFTLLEMFPYPVFWANIAQTKVVSC